jgi:hypothetical protein
MGIEILFVVIGLCFVVQFFIPRSTVSRVMHPERRWLVLFLCLLFFGLAFRESEWMKSGVEIVWTFCQESM